MTLRVQDHHSALRSGEKIDNHSCGDYNAGQAFYNRWLHDPIIAKKRWSREAARIRERFSRGIMSAMSDPIEETQTPIPSTESEVENPAFQTQPVRVEPIREPRVLTRVKPWQQKSVRMLILSLRKPRSNSPLGENIKGFEDTSAFPMSRTLPLPNN